MHTSCIPETSKLAQIEHLVGKPIPYSATERQSAPPDRSGNLETEQGSTPQEAAAHSDTSLPPGEP